MTAYSCCSSQMDVFVTGGTETRHTYRSIRLSFFRGGSGMIWGCLSHDCKLDMVALEADVRRILVHSLHRLLITFDWQPDPFTGAIMRREIKRRLSLALHEFMYQSSWVHISTPCDILNRNMHELEPSVTIFARPDTPYVLTMTTSTLKPHYTGGMGRKWMPTSGYMLVLVNCRVKECHVVVIPVIFSNHNCQTRHTCLMDHIMHIWMD